MTDLRAMFSSMRKRQQPDEGDQSRRTSTGDNEGDHRDLPGTSFETREANSPVADVTVSDSSDDEEGLVKQTAETSARDASHKPPPGLDDISQYPSDGPTQPIIASPVKKQDCNRSFKSSWYKTYPWLEYSEKCDAAFCFACRHFLLPTVHAEEAFTTNGFSNWKKALGKKGRIPKHVVADYHVNAMVSWASFKESEMAGSVLEHLSESYKKEIQENRHFIKTVGEVLLLKGTQNIAQRGHREDDESDNAGNLRRILSLVSGHDIIIRKCLEEGPRNAKYTSPEIQNEMLKTLAQMVREQILEEVRTSEQFSILVDETKDVSKAEQLALFARYYFEGQITESFLCFKDANGLDAQSLSNVVIGLISGYGLDYLVNLVGQGYDGASVMSGAVSGVAKRIQEVAPSAVYVHCYAHRLNLVIVDACKTVKEAANFFALLQQLYVFVSGSNVHQRWLQVQSELFPNEQPCELKRLSDTRWACRADACVVLKARLPAILQLLHRISDNDHGERAIEATGLLAQMDERFAARLVLMTLLLQKTKSLSTMLQQDNLDLSTASSLATVVIEGLQDMRSNNEIWQEVRQLVKDCSDYLTPTRPRRAPRPSTRMEGYHVLEATGQQEQDTPCDDFRANFLYPVLDRMLQEMGRRFSQQNCSLMKALDALTPSSENFLSLENMRALQGTYGANKEDLRHELHQVRRLIERKSAKNEVVPSSMQGLVVFLEPYKDAFFELYRLSKIAAIIPVTSASCEGSFSTMKLIKTYLRNSMGHECLSDLGMLSIERSRAMRLNMERFVDRFAAAHNNRRIKLI